MAWSFAYEELCTVAIVARTREYITGEDATLELRFLAPFMDCPFSASEVRKAVRVEVLDKEFSLFDYKIILVNEIDKV